MDTGFAANFVVLILHFVIFFFLPERRAGQYVFTWVGVGLAHQPQSSQKSLASEIMDYDYRDSHCASL